MLANKAVTDEEIYGALEKVNLADFIRENGGLDKVITEDAANISGGQKQRLALAVNLVAHKDIYVFDEATSNIDIESEAIIMANIKALSRGGYRYFPPSCQCYTRRSDLLYGIGRAEGKRYTQGTDGKKQRLR